MLCSVSESSEVPLWAIQGHWLGGVRWRGLPKGYDGIGSEKEEMNGDIWLCNLSREDLRLGAS